jgi:membrane protease YdiL (CAAX protease family)
MTSTTNLICTFGLLALSVLALWVPVPAIKNSREWLWCGTLAAAVVSGLAGGILGILAPCWVLLLALVSVQARDADSDSARAFLSVLAGAISLLMGMHRLPGFFHTDLLANAGLVLDGKAVKMHGNFDKTVVGVVLMGVFGRPIRDRESWIQMLRCVWPISLATIVVVLGLAVLLGYVKPGFNRHSYLALFLIGNLLSACVTEEAFFRTFLLGRLAHAWSASRYGTLAALIISAVLFGAVHFAGGPVLMALASIAGLMYGTAYLVTRRIEGAILTHFALNAVHYIAFFSPNLQS